MKRDRALLMKYGGLVLLGCLLLLLYGYQLQQPSKPYYDEVHYVRFIRGLINQNVYLKRSNVHPPLWHLMVAGCVKLFGDHSWVWRIVSLISGIGLIGVMYPLTKQITRDSAAAGLAVFFFVFDCLAISQARSAMMNSFMLLCMMASLLFFLRAFGPDGAINRKSYRCAGIFLGLALASKLVSLNMFLFFGVILFRECWAHKENRKIILTESVLSFFVLPLIIFVAAHAVIPFCKDRSLVDIWKITAFHLKYNIGMRQTHGYSSHWWSWPLMFRPIWFYFKGQDWDTPMAQASGILGIGNPLIFWLIPLIVAYHIWQWAARRSSASGLVLLGFFTQWLSYALVGRLQFFHYFYNATPFVAMGLAMIVIRLWRWGSTGQWIVTIYMALVVFMFFYWYPLLTGLPVTQQFYENHVWFRSWV